MKRQLKKALLLFITLALLTCSLTSCLAPKPKTFTVADELRITLTEAFSEKELVGQTAMFQSLDVIVTVLLEEKELIQRDLSVEEYAALVCSGNGLTDSTVKIKDTHAAFSYEKTVSGKDYTYFAKCFKSEKGYWLVQFACFTSAVDKHKENIDTWTASISFS
ncbi:MAG: hypothetical protein E7363_00055 [Clostridiales bacterium]|nr:hypothetical protein [Clostridiales bacterium]